VTILSESQKRSLRKDRIRIEALVVPPLANNVYIVYEDGSSSAIVVDVAQGAQQIFQRCSELSVKPSLIVNTHGHTDHTAEDQKLRNLTGAKLAIHELDSYRLATDDEASTDLGLVKFPIEPDIQLVTGQIIPLGSKNNLSVLHTPGHTEGSICLYEKDAGLLFSGDTLFARGYGRVDGSGADPAAMIKSLKMLLELPPDTEVFPGHGQFTKIKDEEWLREITNQQ
jgi:hydroxyacylglutathione hydrolase